MKSLVKEDRRYVRQDIPVGELPWSRGWADPAGTVPVVLRFSAAGRHLAEDYFDCSELQPESDGGYTVTVYYPEDNWLYGFLLSFGPAAEVLEPEHIRRRLGEIAAGIAAVYSEPRRSRQTGDYALLTCRVTHLTPYNQQRDISCSRKADGNVPLFYLFYWLRFNALG